MGGFEIPMVQENNNYLFGLRRKKRKKLLVNNLQLFISFNSN